MTRSKTGCREYRRVGDDAHQNIELTFGPHEDVGVENDSHPRRREARTAFLMSERFIPAFCA
jgi:hypothetical protein